MQSATRRGREDAVGEAAGAIEGVGVEVWRTREQTENALFTYIDGWYDRERIQGRLGWLAPDEYEHTWHTSRAHPEPVPAR